MSLLFRPFRTLFSHLPIRRFRTTTRSQCESRPDDKPLFPGSRSSWTEKLEFLGSEAYEGIPVYRVTDRDGRVIDPSQDPQLGEEKIIKMYKGIVIPVLRNVQRYFCPCPGLTLSLIRTTRDDTAEHDGSNPVRVTETGKDFILHDELRGRRDTFWICSCTQRWWSCFRSVQRSRSLVVPWIQTGSVYGSMLREQVGQREGSSDANPLWI